MWSITLSRKELFEFYLGGVKGFDAKATSSTGLRAPQGDSITLVWEDDPKRGLSLPTLAVVPDGQVGQVLATVVAAPQAPSPLTSLTRFISQKDASVHFDSDVIPLNEQLFPVFCALSCVEAIAHANGRIGLAQLTPALCRKTLAFAWCKALSARSSPEAIADLPDRWIGVHALLSGESSTSTLKATVATLLPLLKLSTELMIGVRPMGPGGRLAYELLWGSRTTQEEAWVLLSSKLDEAIGIDTLHSLNREERGLHLQRALKVLSSNSMKGSREDGDLVAACAFLATRLSPGSLDHFDILRSLGNQELVAWYAVFASLQGSREFLFARNALGYRLLKDLLLIEDKVGKPLADISFEELSIIRRVGSDVRFMASNSGELRVELIPYVCGSFTAAGRSGERSDVPSSSEQDLLNSSPASLRDRLVRLARELDRISREVDGREGYRKRSKT